MANASVTDRKLLFVDDDPAVLEALCPYFRTRGNTVLTATGVKGALALLAEETFGSAGDFPNVNFPRLRQFGPGRTIGIGRKQMCAVLGKSRGHRGRGRGDLGEFAWGSGGQG